MNIKLNTKIKIAFELSLINARISNERYPFTISLSFGRAGAAV